MKLPKMKSLAIAGVVISFLMMPAAMAQSLFGELRTNTGGAYLGIEMGDVTAENMARYKLEREQGVIVRSVASGSPAERAKIEVDDVILEYGGYPVWSTRQFSRLVQETPEGRTVALLVSRNGKTVNMKATLGGLDQRKAQRSLDVIPQDLFGPDGILRLFRDRIVEPVLGKDVSGSQPRLGLSLQPLTEQMGEFLRVPGNKGALVVSVAEGSPSEGKLRAGDVIIEADGIAVDDLDKLIKAVGEKTSGKISMKIIRDKKEVAVVVELPADETIKKYRL